MNRQNKEHPEVLMATTRAPIARYLHERNWTYEVDSENDRTIAGVRAENVEQFLLAIA
jgi:hypothetical protein